MSLGSRRRWRAAAGYGAGLAAGAAAWQLIGDHSAGYVFSPLTATVSRLGQLIADGSLPGALAASSPCTAPGWRWPSSPAPRPACCWPAGR